MFLALVTGRGRRVAPPGFIDGRSVSDRGLLQAADDLRAQVFVFNFLQQLASVS